MTERPGRTWVARGVLGATALIILTTAVYAPAMRAGFIWDDDVWLWKDPYIRDGGGLLKYWVQPHPKAFDYLPLTSSAFWLQWRLWGMNPAGYHAVNIALHATGALLLWGLLSRLKVPGAWLGALLFAIHPVNVASVAWITELKNTLSMPLALAALLAYLRFETTRRRRWYVAGLALFALALLSKSSVLVLPFVLLILIWWQRREVTRRDLLRSIPFFLLAAVVAVITIHFQHTRAIGVDVHGPQDLMQRFALAGRAGWFYLYKAVWPARLSMIYPRWDIRAVTFVSFVPTLALLAVTATAVIYRKTFARPVAAALGCYWLGLLPVMGWVDMSFMLYSFVADHWHYVALPAMAALAVGAVWRAVAKQRAGVRVAAAVAVTGIVTALSWQTFTQASVYRTEKDLWADTCRKNPDAWIAHNHLGTEFKKAGHFARARNHYQQAIELNPRFAKAHNNLGNLCQDEGKWREAIGHHRRALGIKPNYANALNSLAIALDHIHDNERAEQCYLQALSLEPTNVRAQFNLGLLYTKLGRHDEADKRFRTATELASDDRKLQDRIRRHMQAVRRNRESDPGGGYTP